MSFLVTFDRTTQGTIDRIDVLRLQRNGSSRRSRSSPRPRSTLGCCVCRTHSPCGPTSTLPCTSSLQMSAGSALNERYVDRRSLASSGHYTRSAGASHSRDLRGPSSGTRTGSATCDRTSSSPSPNQSHSRGSRGQVAYPTPSWSSPKASNPVTVDDARRPISRQV
jgi:hypothetical protein